MNCKSIYFYAFYIIKLDFLIKKTQWKCYFALLAEVYIHFLCTLKKNTHF